MWWLQLHENSIWFHWMWFVENSFKFLLCNSFILWLLLNLEFYRYTLNWTLTIHLNSNFMVMPKNEIIIQFLSFFFSFGSVSIPFSLFIHVSLRSLAQITIHIDWIPPLNLQCNSVNPTPARENTFDGMNLISVGMFDERNNS